MAIFLCLILAIWLACVHQKLNSLTRSIEFLRSSLNRLNMEEDIKNQPSACEPKAEPVKEEASVEKIQVQSQPEISQVSPKFNDLESKNNIDIKKLNSVKSNSDIQNVFLGNIFNKIGAITIIVAVIIFIKLVSPFIHLTPQMTVGAGYLAGIAMAVGALYLHRKEKFKAFSEVLLGTGFATLFINTFCAYSYFKVFSTATALCIGGTLLLITYIIADRMKTLSMLVIGLLGGYLTPFLSGAEKDVIFGYLIFLNLISLIYTLKNKHNKVINVVNLVLTMFIMVDYNLFNKINPVYPLVLWLVYLPYDILRDKSSKLDTTLSGINYFVLTLFTLILFDNDHFCLGVVFASTAVGYLILAVLSRISKSELYKYYEHYILINVWLFILFILNDMNSVIAWAAIPFVVALLIKFFKLDYLKSMVVWYYLSAFIGVLTAHIEGNYVLMANYNPILNLRALIVGTPAISMLASSYILKNSGKNISNLLKFSGVSLIYLYISGEVTSMLNADGTNSSYKAFNLALSYVILGFMYAINMKFLYNSAKSLLYDIAGYIIAGISLFALMITSYIYPEGYVVLLNMRVCAYAAAILLCLIYIKYTKAEFFKYLAVILGFLLVHSESVGVKNVYGDEFQYIISLSWVLYSGIVTTIGIIKSKNFLKYIGIVLSLLTVARIFIFDLARVESVYKLIICLVLGVILMLVSYIYTAKNKN